MMATFEGIAILLKNPLTIHFMLEQYEKGVERSREEPNFQGGKVQKTPKGKQIEGGSKSQC